MQKHSTVASFAVAIGTPKSLRDFTKAHIERVLDMADYDLEKTADLLEIPLPRLRRYMAKLGIPKRNGVPKQRILAR